VEPSANTLWASANAAARAARGEALTFTNSRLHNMSIGFIGM
jgi:hypothetical protein